MARDETTLLDMANAARLIHIFIQGMTNEAFLGNLKTQSAVLHQVTVIGEAVKRLSQAFRERHPIPPWALMAGMRDHLIHGYDVVDLEEVWKTAPRDMPEVLRKFGAAAASATRHMIVSPHRSQAAEPTTAADGGERHVAAWRPRQRLVLGPPPPLSGSVRRRDR